MKQLKQLKGLIPLNHNVKIYVPSTVNVNKASNNEQQVNNLMAVFSQLFGGATTFEAKGAWDSATAGLVVESITIVESYCSEEQLKKGIDTLIIEAKKLRKELKQEAISLEIDNKLYFI